MRKSHSPLVRLWKMTDGRLTGRGMAVTLGGILLFEVISQTVIKLPTLTVLTILVGWAGFAGGLRTGFLSATLTSMYAVYFFSTPANCSAIPQRTGFGCWPSRSRLRRSPR
ncbi:MAG: hypothetical protein WKH64_07155 [Chloroflexia bacterium]